jgi:4-amino-4-deoxy-L-arabinose transferase-like glycosyltransferase
MDALRSWRSRLTGSFGLPVALAMFLFHVFTNGQYGFHRDELATLDDAQTLAWGYVAYPPFTPLIGKIGLTLFGLNLAGVRMFGALALAIEIVLAATMARDLGGRRLAQIVAAVGMAISPPALYGGVVLSYVAFDFLWWVAIATMMIKLIKTNDARWWLGIGAAIGLGMMTKYTMAFFVVALGVGVLLTPLRRYLRSPYLWGGAAIAVLIFAPNLIWQIQHNFISLEFLGSIHERDIAQGRTDKFLIEQFYGSANPLTIPLWGAGLFFYFFRPEGKPFRALGWMFVTVFALFFVSRGSFYYTAPAYPMLIAGGAALGERWVGGLKRGWAVAAKAVAWAMLTAGGVMGVLMTSPLTPVKSPLWNFTNDTFRDIFSEQIGWPELVETVHGIYAKLPPDEQAQAGILAGNYGEAGAINLMGPQYGLPGAISGVNSLWYRGYGDPPPKTVIVLGFARENALRIFEQCELAGQISNRYGVENEETLRHKDIFVCRSIRAPWPEIWPHLRDFG